MSALHNRQIIGMKEAMLSSNTHSNRYEGHRPGKHGYKAGKPDFKSNETRQHSDRVKHGQGEPGKKFRKSRHTSEKQMSSEADVTQTVSDAEDSGD